LRPPPHAVDRRPEFTGSIGPQDPITGIAGCCARAASGHAAAVLPSPAMNSRRRISHASEPL